MNIYEVWGGETAWGVDKNGDECLVNLVYHVIAPTRGRARYLFMCYFNEFGADYSFTDAMRIRLLAKDVGLLPEGVDEDYVWALANLPDFKIHEVL